MLSEQGSQANYYPTRRQQGHCLRAVFDTTANKYLKLGLSRGLS
jgi:hypothetical protein